MMHHGGKRTVSSGRGETKMQEGQPRADRDLAGGAHNKSDNVRDDLTGGPTIDPSIQLRMRG